MQKIVAANGGVETVTPLSVVTWTAEPVKAAGQDGSDRVVAYYGEAAGGEPGRAYLFTDPTQASRVLLSGELLRGVRYGFSNGAPDGKRPRAVLAVNVRGGTPATYAVKDNANKTVFTLETLTYREAANQTVLSLSGSRAAGFNLQVRDPLTGAGVGYTKLGIGLYVQYVGGGKSATAEITTLAGVPHFKTTVVGGAVGESLLIPLTGLTVRQLAQQIQQSGPYNVLTARSASLAATALDPTTAALNIRAYGLVGEVDTEVAANATAVTLKAATTRAYVAGETLKFRASGAFRFVQLAQAAVQGATSLTIAPVSFAIPANATLLDSTTAEPVALPAVKADFEDFLTTRGEGAVRYLPGAADAADPVAQGGNFSGGGSQAATITDWERGVDASLEEDFGSACALTDDQGIVFGVRARLQAARNPREGKFVQLFSGVDSALLPQGESAAELDIYLRNVASHVAAINDHDSVVLAQAADVVNPDTGRVERAAPYLVAAVAAGFAASVGRETSMTYKSLAAANPFPNLRTRKDDFTLAGVTVLVPPKQGQAARVELGRTAYVGEDNTIYESEKSVRLMNSVAREIKLIQEALVPGEATASALARYKRELTRYFDGLVEKGLIQSGYDQDGNFVQAYEFQVGRTQYQGRLVTTTAQINPTGEFVVADFGLRARPVEIEV